MKQKDVKKLAVFASGNGSNAEKIFEYFKEKEKVEVALLLTNNPKAPVIDRAKRHNVPVEVFNRTRFYDTNEITEMLLHYKIDLVVLAGFMWLIPPSLIKAFPDKILNIHPALLPKYGGKGMYGDFVHKAVVAAKEKESGITIHLVNENYDEGQIVFQEKCTVEPHETPETLAGKIHLLEHRFYPQVIENILLK